MRKTITPLTVFYLGLFCLFLGTAFGEQQNYTLLTKETYMEMESVGSRTYHPTERTSSSPGAGQTRSMTAPGATSGSWMSKGRGFGSSLTETGAILPLFGLLAARRSLFCLIEMGPRRFM